MAGAECRESVHVEPETDTTVGDRESIEHGLYEGYRLGELIWIRCRETRDGCL
jgi:hypothetical protein